MSSKALDLSFNIYLRKKKKMLASSKKDAGWILIKLCTSSQQNNRLWLNGSETTLDFTPGLILTGPATVLFPTADASFSNVSEKAVTHKQEQISLACRKGKLLAEINLQMLGFQREELADGEGLPACPAPPLPSLICTLYLAYQDKPGTVGALLGLMLGVGRSWAPSLRTTPLFTSRAVPVPGPGIGPGGP